MEDGSDGVEGVSRGGEADFRRSGAGTEDDEGRAAVEAPAGGNVRLVAPHVAVADGDKACLTVEGEGEFVGSGVDASALAVNGLDTEIHEVGAVGAPSDVFGCDAESDSLAGRIDPVTGNGLAVIIGDGFQTQGGKRTTFCWGYVLPHYLIPLFAIILVIFLPTRALAVDKQFHLVGVGIGEDLMLCLVRSNVYERFVGHEDALHQICLRPRFERDIEHTSTPPFHRPAHALAEVVNDTPVGEADNTIEVHLEVVPPHAGDGGLALVEGHPGVVLAVEGEIDVAVVVGLYIGLEGEVRGQGVCLPVAVAGVHGDSHEARRVVALQESLLQAVHSKAEIVERHVRFLL